MDARLLQVCASSSLQSRRVALSAWSLPPRYRTIHARRPATALTQRVWLPSCVCGCGSVAGHRI
jgi:hypothetical protein